MTHRILKSALAPPPVTFDQAKQAFSKLVDILIHELQAWTTHDMQVKAQQPLRPLPRPEDHAAAEDPATAFWKDYAAWQGEKLSRVEPYPRPIAHHPDIAAAVTMNIGTDGYVTYVPDFEIINDDPTPEQILAAKKAFLLQAVKEAEAAAANCVLLPAGKRRLSDLREADIRRADPKTISASDKQHLLDQDERRAKIDAIARTAAQAMSDVEDLTTADVDSFTIPSLQS